MLLGQLHPDAPPVEQLLELSLVLDVGAGRVAEGVAAPPVGLLGEQLVEVPGVLVAEAELSTDPCVPALRQRLGELHRQPVQLHVLPVGVAGEQRVRDLGDVRPHRDDLEGNHVGLAGLRGPEEVGQAQPPVATLPGEGEPAALGPRGRVEHDKIFTLADRWEVAVHDGGLHDALGLHPGEQLAQPRPALGLHQLFVRRAVAATRPTQPPLAEEQRPFVDPWGVVSQRDALGDPAAPERRLRDAVVTGHVGAAAGLGVGLAQAGRGDRPGPGMPCGPLLIARLCKLKLRRTHLATLDGHHLVHQAQPLESVPGVPDLTVVHRGEVLLDVGPGERSATQDHRVARGNTTRVHLQQVLFHDDRALDKQAAHPDDVGVVLLRCLQDRRDRLLDPDVDHVVTVVRQDDVDKVLADVVDVALDGRQDNLAFAFLALDLLHVRLEVCDRGLHHLRALQHEGQLHLARAEQLADRLHPRQQRLVDNRQGRPAGGHRLLEVGLETVLLTIDDPSFQPLGQRQRHQGFGARHA